jgi:hypothetical protein
LHYFESDKIFRIFKECLKIMIVFRFILILILFISTQIEIKNSNDQESAIILQNNIIVEAEDLRHKISYIEIKYFTLHEGDKLVSYHCQVLSEGKVLHKNLLWICYFINYFY